MGTSGGKQHQHSPAVLSSQTTTPSFTPGITDVNDDTDVDVDRDIDETTL